METTIAKVNNANLDLGTKYIIELKNNNFKISDDLMYNENLENYENDLETKIKGFDFIKKNFESSTKFIDKLRMYLRCQEISPESIIIRECELNAERFLYLVSKKYFDFGILRHLNLSRNNLGDYGGSCLLTLIKSLFEERAKSLSQRMEFAEVQEYSGPFVHHERPGEEWDVPITEEIKYFDPELSYELTGYRPITMEKGLDFDPEPFREMAILYETNGEYTKFPKGSKPHRDL